jgi:hypothetical protein
MKFWKTFREIIFLDTQFRCTYKTHLTQGEFTGALNRYSNNYHRNRNDVLNPKRYEEAPHIFQTDVVGNCFFIVEKNLSFWVEEFKIRGEFKSSDVDEGSEIDLRFSSFGFGIVLAMLANLYLFIKFCYELVQHFVLDKYVDFKTTGIACILLYILLKSVSWITMDMKRNEFYKIIDIITSGKRSEYIVGKLRMEKLIEKRALESKKHV